MIHELDENDDYISIGELSSVTGIGVHTLRVWEKRYGAPHSTRLPSGHRRYPKKEVARLKAIASAIESGYRASKVATATLEELQSLMGLTPITKQISDTKIKQQEELISGEAIIESWIPMISTGKDDQLFYAFHEQFGRHGPLSFICNFAAPLMERIGIGWETGELTITNEHFASECLVSFLNEKWRQLNSRKTGRTVLITTLPGEIYNLGTLMCAMITAATNSKIIYLGSDIPAEEIIDASEKYKPKLITISISHKFDLVTSEKALVNLRKNIDTGVQIITGGKGSPCNIHGISYIHTFKKYYDFLTKQI